MPWSEGDSTCVQVRGKLAGVSSLLPPCGSWDQTQFSGLAPSALSTEPSQQPYALLLETGPRISQARFELIM